MKDLTYMRAELVMAYQEGRKTITVDRAELQSIVDRLHRLQEHSDKVPKLLGYIIGNDLRNMRLGHHMFAKIKRKNTGRFDCPVYFLEMPKATEAPEVAPVPPDVYYDAEGDHFYSKHDNRCMGMAFWQVWRNRRLDFPSWPENKELEDCMPDFDSMDPPEKT